MLREPVLLISGIAAGALLSGHVPGYVSKLAPVFLVLMLWGAMLTLPPARVFSVMQNRRVVVLNLLVNFTVIPVLAFLMSLRFASQPELMLGLFLYLALPCTDWFLTFTSMARGSVAQGVLLIPVNLSLQLALLPLYLLLFYGASVPFSWKLFAETLLLFFLLPLLMAFASKRVFPSKLNLLISRAQTLFLSLAVMCILASQQSIYRSTLELFPVFGLAIVYFALVLPLSHLLSRIFNLKREEAILLYFTTSARNSPVALAVAMGTFPGMPLIHTLLALMPVIEVPVLVLVARFLSVKR